jgi:imidazolonepropionase-like amidohydrolase
MDPRDTRRRADRGARRRSMMVRGAWYSLLFAALGVSFTCRGESTDAAAPATITVVHAGRLIDTETGRVLEHQNILIQAGRVVSVGPDTGSLPADAAAIDLSAYTVLPGLIDMHTHLTIDHAAKDPLAELQHTAAVEAFKSLPNARAVLLAGFTTVRDLGPYRALVDVALRDAINRGDVVGPRMFVAGAYVTITGGAGAVTGFSPDVTLPWDLRFGNANSPTEVRERIRALASQRVDVIKMFATGAVLTHNSNPFGREATREELEAAVDEAHNFGLKVAVHAHGAEGIKTAIRAGVASIEHGTLMDDEGRALMRQHGTYLVPTLEVTDCVLDGYPAEFQAKMRAIQDAQRKNFRKAVAAGVKIAFGTDIGVCDFGQNALEFNIMVQNGMTPMQAIQSATIGSADLLGKSDELGSLRPGKWADLVAVRDDPLADIRSLENVGFVMKQGVVYKRVGSGTN